MRQLKRFHCVDCDEWTERYRDSGQPLTCYSCGIARAVDAAVELARYRAEGWPENPRWPRETFQRGGYTAAMRAAKQGG